MIDVPSANNLVLLLTYVLHRSILIENEVYDNLRSLDARLDALEAKTMNIAVNNGQLIIEETTPQEEEEENNG